MFYQCSLLLPNEGNDGLGLSRHRDGAVLLTLCFDRVPCEDPIAHVPSRTSEIRQLKRVLGSTAPGYPTLSSALVANNAETELGVLVRHPEPGVKTDARNLTTVALPRLFKARNFTSLALPRYVPRTNFRGADVEG